MDIKTLLQLDSVEVTQSKRGAISFAYNDKTDAMFDLYAHIAKLEEENAELRKRPKYDTGTVQGREQVVIDRLKAQGLVRD